MSWSTCKAISRRWIRRACGWSSRRWPIPDVDIGTLVVPIRDEIEAATVSFVKAACAFRTGQTIAPALYFSRQAIPWGPGPRWHHVGIYAYRRAVLDRYVSLPPSPLERRESLEQLRALENGMRIACVRMEHGPFGVDTPEDLERARVLLAARPWARR